MTVTTMRPRRAGAMPRAWLRCLLAMALLGVLGGVQAQGFDVEEVLPCSEPQDEEDLTLEECQQARELIMFECSACHTIAPVVQAQKTPEEWESTFDAHADRIEHLSDEDVALLQRYLTTTFNPDNPVPELPDSLKEQGSNQAF